MTRTTRTYVLGALIIAIGGAVATLPATDALAKNGPPSAADTLDKKGSRPPKPDAPVIKGPRPPRPAVTTQIEPGIVNVEKLNKEVKNSKKRRQFADFDRKKYGIADNLLRELGHKHGDRNGRGGTPSRGGRR